MSIDLLIIITTLFAGLIQGVSGFGAGIVVMSVLPFFLPLIGCAGISNFMSIFITMNMAWHYRNHIQWKAIPVPAVFFITGGSLAIWLAPAVDAQFMKIVFGIFLIILSIYFSFFSSKVKIQANLLTMFVCGFISGICDGLFGVGGPLMVLFYLALTQSKEEYLGTIQAFFFITVTWNFFFRVTQGLFTIDLLEESLCSVCGVLIGISIGHRLVAKMDGAMLQKLVYALIGISGVVTLINALIL